MLIMPANQARLTPVQAAFCNVTITGLQQSWALYEIWDAASGKLLYIGCNRLSDITAAPDARTSPDWPGNSHPISIAIKYIGTRVDVLNARGDAIRQLPATPPCNVRSRRFTSRVVICNETGETFRTQAEAARATGCSQSNIAQHLRGKPGFRSVKGRTFRYAHKESINDTIPL